MKQFKSFMVMILVVALAIVNLPAEALAYEYYEYGIGYDYENPYSAGYISIHNVGVGEDVNSIELYYELDNSTEIEKTIQIKGTRAGVEFMYDYWGTVYAYAENDLTDENSRFYQVFYYNRDINKRSMMEPLLNENGNYVYTSQIDSYNTNHLDENNKRLLKIMAVVDDDGTKGCSIMPRFDLMKQQYDALYPNITPEPDPTPELTEVPDPTIEPTQPSVPTTKPTEKPEPTAEPTKSPEATVEPSKVPEPTIELTKEPVPTEAIKTPVPTVEPSKNPEPTGNPSPSLAPHQVSNEKEIVKAGNEVWIEQGDQIIAKVSFNKKKGTASFKIGEKNKKVKNLKQAFLIEDSYNYGYITKKNDFVTVNRQTGKVKKYSGKWKKAIIVDNVAVKIVKKKGSKKKSITGF